VHSAEIDGVAVDPRAIPLRLDGKTHDVKVVMGKPGAVAVGVHRAGDHAGRVP
jgi:hypothetical protein